MGNPRIIIADNDIQYSLKSKEALKEAGFTVDSVDNGLDAYHILRSSPPELLIISDLLPRVKSIVICRQIKEGKLIEPIPVILLSKRLPSELVLEWPHVEKCVDLILVKPYAMEDLVVKVRQLLSVSSRDDQIKIKETELPPEIMAKLQRELEKKALAIARLESDKKELLQKLNEASPLNEPIEEILNNRLEEMRLELAARDLRLAELEVKLEEMIRLKAEFDEKTQDMLEKKTKDERILKRKFVQMMEVRDSFQQEIIHLKSDMERALVEKERIEEKSQALKMSWEKDKKDLEQALGEARERITSLEKETTEGRQTIEEAGRELEGQQKDFRMREEQLLGQIRDFQEERESFSRGVQEGISREEIEEYEGKLKSIEKERDHFKEELDGATSELEKVKGEFSKIAEEKEREKARLNDVLAQSEMNHEKFRSRVEELIKGAEDQEELLHEMKNENEALKKKLQESERSLAAEKGARKAMEEEYQLQLMSESEKGRELQEKVNQMKERLSELGSTDFEHFKGLEGRLVEAVRSAQKEIVERSRAEADLSARLESLIREKDEFARRVEKELNRAEERENRLQELLDRSLTFQSGASAFNLPARFSWSEKDEETIENRWPKVVTAAVILVLLASAAFYYYRWKKGGTEEGMIASEEIGTMVKSRSGPLRTGVEEVANEELKGLWEAWTRKSVSGGVIVQATLRGPDEMKASLEAEAEAGGWSRSEKDQERLRREKIFDFDRYYYFYIYLKNLEPGYPDYADNLHRLLYLRDNLGGEVEGTLPENIPNGKAVYSHSAGPMAKEDDQLLYEVASWVVFPRDRLVARPRYLQLIAYDIGSTSRRVFTWEMIVE